jgi:hypothetical protein
MEFEGPRLSTKDDTQDLCELDTAAMRLPCTQLQIPLIVCNNQFGVNCCQTSITVFANGVPHLTATDGSIWRVGVVNVLQQGLGARQIFLQKG